MTQSLLLIVIFIGLLACMPMAVNRLKKRYGLTQLGPTHDSRLVSVLAVGPQQKVVTVEVGPPEAKVWLVLGVTAQSVNHLHTMPPGAAVPVGGVAQAAAVAGATGLIEP